MNKKQVLDGSVVSAASLLLGYDMEELTQEMRSFSHWIQTLWDRHWPTRNNLALHFIKTRKLESYRRKHPLRLPVSPV